MSTYATETIALSEVRPLERNPRKHPEAQIRELAKSVEQFGQYRPLVIDETGEILAGNGLYYALSDLGHTEALVLRLEHLSQGEKNKLVLADNKLSYLASDDYDVMEELMRELDDFEVPGFDPESLRQLLADAETTISRAEEYGSLDTEEVEQLRARQARAEERGDQATVGTPPTPQTPLDLDSIEDDVRPADDGGEQSTVCPTCHRPW